MELDIVHDTQETYRKLVNSMSRPGTISMLHGEVPSKIPVHYSTFLTALTLLDGEVCFHVVSDKKNIGKVLADYTLAKLAPLEEADYIVVPNGTTDEEILHALKVCKIGSLVDPQQSSTWIIEQDVISLRGSLTLTGPGIKYETTLHLDVNEAFWKMREEKVNEFPMGTDLIFTDPISLACIPRTTNVFLGGVL